MEIPHTVVRLESTPPPTEVIGIFRTYVPDYAPNKAQIEAEIAAEEADEDVETKVVARPRGRRPKSTQGAETK